MSPASSAWARRTTSLCCGTSMVKDDSVDDAKLESSLESLSTRMVTRCLPGATKPSKRTRSSLAIAEVASSKTGAPSSRTTARPTWKKRGAPNFRYTWSLEEYIAAPTAPARARAVKRFSRMRSYSFCSSSIFCGVGAGGGSSAAARAQARMTNGERMRMSKPQWQKQRQPGGDGHVVDDEVLVEELLLVDEIPDVDAHRHRRSGEELEAHAGDAAHPAARRRVDHAGAGAQVNVEVDDLAAELQLAMERIPEQRPGEEAHRREGVAHGDRAPILDGADDVRRGVRPPERALDRGVLGHVVGVHAPQDVGRFEEIRDVVAGVHRELVPLRLDEVARDAAATLALEARLLGKLLVDALGAGRGA